MLTVNSKVKAKLWLSLKLFCKKKQKQTSSGMTEFLISCFFPEFHINHVFNDSNQVKKGGKQNKRQNF